MPDISLEELAARVEALEKRTSAPSAAPPPRKKDWRRTIGMFAGSEFMKQVDAECAAAREAERAAARAETPSDPP